jgi:hypothetical protein
MEMPLAISYQLNYGEWPGCTLYLLLHCILQKDAAAIPIANGIKVIFQGIKKASYQDAFLFVQIILLLIEHLPQPVF